MIGFERKGNPIDSLQIGINVRKEIGDIFEAINSNGDKCKVEAIEEESRYISGIDIDGIEIEKRHVNVRKIDDDFYGYVWSDSKNPGKWVLKTLEEVVFKDGTIGYKIWNI
jgi:hypothetical protein